MIVVAATAESGDKSRVALSPETAKKFKALGAEVRLQAGAGRGSFSLISPSPTRAPRSCRPPRKH